MRSNPPFPKYPEYMNGRLKKIDMAARLDHMKNGLANKRLRGIGLKPLYDIPQKNNPLPWTEHWISSKGLQVAPQETEVESYIVGGIKQDIKKDSFAGFKL